MTDPEARARARATWSAGDFDAIAERIWGVGADLVTRVDVATGDSVLDVACGSGNASIPAAVAGGRVTGLDITPELLEAGRRRAAEAEVEIEWVEGDAEQLPFEDGSFDVVLSTFGCMFAPDHEATAAEIARVVAPDGRLGIAAWTPFGAIGTLFRTLMQFADPPPEGFKPPPFWGVEDYVAKLFEGKGVELEFAPTLVRFNFDSIEEAVTEYEEKFGPVVLLKARLESEGRWDEGHGELLEFFDRVNTASDGSFAFDADYLLTLGRKPG